MNITNPKNHHSKNKYKCSICKDKRGVLTGKYCRDNEKSKHYDDELITDTDYIDCWVFIRGNETEEQHRERLNIKGTGAIPRERELLLL